MRGGDARRSTEASANRLQVVRTGFHQSREWSWCERPRFWPQAQRISRNLPVRSIEPRLANKLHSSNEV
jgi:hypothetical protein